MSHANTSRDRIFGALRTLRPDLIDRRNRTHQKYANEYTVPGPNFIWLLDGHDKLSNWNIDIYAGIDAHSRFVMWLYVGVSNRTAVSILRQYLQTVRHMEQHPRFVRSDRGTETVLAAAAHHYLHKAFQPDIEVKHCWIYGKSAANQRIESWWSKVVEVFIYRIRVSQLSRLILCTKQVQYYF